MQTRVSVFFFVVVHLTGMLHVVTQKLAHIRKITLAGAHKPHAGIESQLRPGAEGLGAQQEFLHLLFFVLSMSLSLSSLLLYKLWAENARIDKNKVASVVIMEKHTRKQESSIIHIVMACTEKSFFPHYRHIIDAVCESQMSDVFLLLSRR